MSESSYRHLRADRIIATLEKLRARIVDRFPEAGLASLCGELVGTARTLSREAAQLSRPSFLWPLAALAVLGIGAVSVLATLRCIWRAWRGARRTSFRGWKRW